MKAYTEESFLLENRIFEPVSSGNAHAPISAGTFSLRRANYFAQSGSLLLSPEQERALASLIREADLCQNNEIIANNLH
jgi:hypothetical protein